MGIADVEVDYEGQRKKLPLVVTPGDTPTLLGRNWLKQLQIDWNRVFSVFQVKEIKDGRPEQLNEVLERNKDVFKEELGKLKDFSGLIQTM